MLDTNVLEQFRRSTLTPEGYLILPDMDRRLYDQCKKILERMGFKWDGRKSVRAHVMVGDLDPALALAELVESGEVPNGNEYAFWPSSDRLIDLLFDAASQLYAKFNYVLEPNAGDGAIVRRVLRDYDSTIEWLAAVEINEKRAQLLRQIPFMASMSARVLCGDFLAEPVGPTFDTVVMNPPFALAGSPLAYVDHILHAWKFLKPRGVLSSVVPAGFVFRSDAKIVTLREMFEDRVASNDGVLLEYGSNPKDMKTGTYMYVVAMRK